MNKTTFLISISLGTLIYVAVSMFCGQSGLWAETQLIKERNQLCSNLTEIKKINDELVLEHTALSQDPDLISSYAKSLGFVHEGEHIVKISGIPAPAQKAYSVGKYYDMKEINFVPEWICKLLGISVTLLSMIIFSLISISEKSSVGKVSEGKGKDNRFTEVPIGNF